MLGGDDGRVACDHVNRYTDDVRLMAELGLGAYRFSVSWPRVMPDGKRLAPEGLDFYSRLVDELLARGIEPLPTLFHWDLPQTLEDEGGWRSRDTAERFAEYAVVVHDALGDRIRQWTTINEPFCSAFLGYGSGVHAPGVREPGTALVAAHHHLLAHGRAVSALRAQARPDQVFALALNFAPGLADGDSPAHLEAIRKWNAIHNRFFLDPVLGRGYAEDVLADVAHLGALEPAIKDGDMDVIGAKIDWLGVNFYAPTRVTPIDDPTQPSNAPLPGLRGMNVLPARGPLTSFGWEQTPSSLTDLLQWLHSYCDGLPLVVAENGASFEDTVSPDGHVHDTERTAYFASHIRAVHDAIESGADVRGYVAWSLMDNFEWSLGYSQRFGLIHVDFDSLRRTVKDSGRFYSEIIARNAVPAV